MKILNDLRRQKYDVVLIGGGPAGSTTATLLAEKSYRVLLLEREPGPRFKIGESLVPASYWTFKRLGVLEKLKSSHFPKKYSVQFYSRLGKASSPFYFSETNSHESSMTWQVLRSEFDEMLLENAREKGVEVRLGTIAREVLFEGNRAVGVRVKSADGKSQDVSAQVVVDATGQSALISRKLKLHETDTRLRNASIYTHFQGAVRDKGIDEGATLILHTKNKDSWFWYIPLPYDRVSVGVVASIDYLLQSRRKSNGRLDHQSIFHEELDICPSLKPRLEHAIQLFPVKTAKDFSYRVGRMAGDGWVLVGDALGFLDPVYSTGLFLALKSGEMVADAIDQAFERSNFSAVQLGEFSAEFVKGMDVFRQMVYAFYTRQFSFAEFLKQYPEYEQGIIDVLSGNVFYKDVNAIFSAMRSMCPLLDDSG